jgi:hypothetical protein
LKPVIDDHLIIILEEIISVAFYKAQLGLAEMPLGESGK